MTEVTIDSNSPSYKEINNILDKLPLYCAYPSACVEVYKDHINFNTQASNSLVFKISLTEFIRSYEIQSGPYKMYEILIIYRSRDIVDLSVIIGYKYRKLRPTAIWEEYVDLKYKNFRCDVRKKT